MFERVRFSRSGRQSPCPSVRSRRWCAAEQSFSAEVFVEVGPVEAVASACETLRQERSGFRQKAPARKERALTPSQRLKFLRWAGAASSRRGYYTSGRLIMRPSRRETLRASSVNSTPNTRSSAADAEKLIPCLRELRLLLDCISRSSCAPGNGAGRVVPSLRDSVPFSCGLPRTYVLG